MDPLTFVSSLVSSLAWPAAIVVAAVMFRREIRAAIGRLRRAKLGPGEVELSEEIRDARAELKKATETAPSQEAAPEVDAATEAVAASLQPLVDQAPWAAVVQAANEVETSLRELLREAGVAPDRRWGIGQMARQAAQGDLIDRATADAAAVIQRARNRSVHEGADTISDVTASGVVELSRQVLRTIEVARHRVRAASGPAEASGAAPGTRSSS